MLLTFFQAIPNNLNVSADWLVCLWISAGREGSHHQPLCFLGEGVWESFGWRSLSTRDFHSYFLSFKGRMSGVYGGEENNMYLEFPFDISRVRVSVVLLPGETKLC